MYPLAGERPTLPLSDVLSLPVGTRVGGLAPIGVRWLGTVATYRGRRYIHPDKGCPRGEFAPCTVVVSGVLYDIR